jgi:hypothetical protein
MESRIICSNCKHYIAIDKGKPKCELLGHYIMHIDEGYAVICDKFWNKHIYMNFMDWVDADNK